MKLISFDENMVALGSVLEGYADIEIGDSSTLNTFEVTGMDNSIKYIAVLGDEYGGVIERSDDGTTFKRTGFTWRGLLTQWLIEPYSESGIISDDTRCIVSGDINIIVHDIILNVLGGFFSTNPEPLGINVDNYAFPIHCTVLEGLMGLCEAYNCRLDIRNFIENGRLKVFVSAKQAEHKILGETAFSSTVTISDMGINHLICWAQRRVEGENDKHEYMRKDLYLHPDGNITFEQYYTGFRERQAVFEDGTYKNDDEFVTNGIKKLTELAGFIKMDITHVSADADVGDFLMAKKGSLVVEQPVVRKILTFSNGVFNEEIKMKGQN